ncbi:hypothetical protein KDL44_15195 [bacterium]|nr:hypothetical protein [bacterium]
MLEFLFTLLLLCSGLATLAWVGYELISLFNPRMERPARYLKLASQLLALIVVLWIWRGFGH